LTGAPAARGREHPHHPRGRRRVREAGDAVQHRQGLLGDAAPGEKAFAPGPLPFPLLHVDTTWKFREMIAFRDQLTGARRSGFELLVHTNQEGARRASTRSTHGSNKYTGVMKTDALKQALDKYGFDAAFGGARRDEEKSRAKERVYSFRDRFQQWDPKNQRPELWNLYNGKINKGESIRVFPLSNWTELDVWLYIWLENIPIVPLYFAGAPGGRARRHADHGRRRPHALEPGESPR
jgi:sulfate adenylyltransferase small subunit